MAKVSVLIPVYNSEKYIENTLNSVVEQTLQDIEIIIVNDGSKDDSEKIIKKFIDKYKNIKYFYKENSGVADTRNYLISKASGEYIGFVDSDDTIDKEMYKKMYECAKEKDSDIVICGLNEIHDEFTIKNSGLFNDNIENKLLMPPSLCNKIIKKKLFDNNNFPNIMIGEDMVVVLNALNKTNKISYINEYFYNYYKRNNSIMNQNKYRNYWNDIFTAFNLIEKNINSHEELEYLFIQHILRDSSIKFMYFKEGKESLKLINDMTRTKYPKFYKNKYYRLKNWRYKLICQLIYHKQYYIVKIIRKVLKSDR